MKFKKTILCLISFLLIATLGSCTTPIKVNTQIDRPYMVELYLGATVTVLAYGNGNSMGSGIAIHSGGYIATNYHVINNAVEGTNENSYIKVEMVNAGELKQYDASILWYNEDFDLAVIRSDYHEMPYVKMKDRWIDSNDSLRYAEEIWTLGTPIDRSLYGTYSEGCISCAKPNLPRNTQESQGNFYEHLIQHTASISNGNSGGGLFDAEGNLVGLNTLSVVSSSSSTANDLYFATPIYPLINIISQIVELEEDGDPLTNYSYPSIEAEFTDRIIESSFNESGVLVTFVEQFGASDSVLLEEDIIIGIRGESSESNFYKVDIRNDFLYALSNFSSGETVNITVKRKGSSEIVSIVLASETK